MMSDDTLTMVLGEFGLYVSLAFCLEIWAIGREGAKGF